MNRQPASYFFLRESHPVSSYRLLVGCRQDILLIYRPYEHVFRAIGFEGGWWQVKPQHFVERPHAGPQLPVYELLNPVDFMVLRLQKNRPHPVGCEAARFFRCR